MDTYRLFGNTLVSNKFSGVTTYSWFKLLFKLDIKYAQWRSKGFTAYVCRWDIR
jgi:hypothetical protein